MGSRGVYGSLRGCIDQCLEADGLDLRAAPRAFVSLSTGKWCDSPSVSRPVPGASAVNGVPREWDRQHLRKSGPLDERKSGHLERHKLDRDKRHSGFRLAPTACGRRIASRRLNHDRACVAAALGGVMPVEFPTGEHEVPLLERPIRAVDGWVEVPDGPGLGVTVNAEAVRRFRQRSG